MHAKIVESTLTDGSKVFDVVLTDGASIVINALDLCSAEKMLASIIENSSNAEE